MVGNVILREQIVFISGEGVGNGLEDLEGSHGFQEE